MREGRRKTLNNIEPQQMRASSKTKLICEKKCAAHLAFFNHNSLDFVLLNGHQLHISFHHPDHTHEQLTKKK
jgi:hypothetical protein